MSIRRITPAITGTIGLVLAAVLVGLGLVMTSNANFAKTYTAEQLGQQKITFSSVEALTPEESQSPCLIQYAGQQLTTGKQAECYANDFIGLHVTKIGGGKTYAEMRGPEQALLAKVTAAQKANDPGLAELQKQHAIAKGQRDAVFQGETSRGLLLTSFGFSVLGAKAEQAATTAYLVAGLVALLSLVILARGRGAARTAGAGSPTGSVGIPRQATTSPSPATAEPNPGPPQTTTNA